MTFELHRQRSSHRETTFLHFWHRCGLCNIVEYNIGHNHAQSEIPRFNSVQEKHPESAPILTLEYPKPKLKSALRYTIIRDLAHVLLNSPRSWAFRCCCSTPLWHRRRVWCGTRQVDSWWISTSATCTVLQNFIWYAIYSRRKHTVTALRCFRAFLFRFTFFFFFSFSFLF